MLTKQIIYSTRCRLFHEIGARRRLALGPNAARLPHTAHNTGT